MKQQTITELPYWKQSKSIEILLGLCVFIWMLLHPSYLGTNEYKSLIIITILSLPTAIALCAGVWLNRKTWIVLLLIGLTILFLGIKAHRGNDHLLAEGDRDDAVVTLSQGLLDGEFTYDTLTFLNGPITTGPTSGLLALPSVALSGSNTLTSVALFLLLILALYKKHHQILLPTSIAFIAFHNHFNWGYWECSEEILYGWAFLIPAISILEKYLLPGSKSMIPLSKLLLIGILFGLAVGVRINYAIPVVLIGMIIFFRQQYKEAILLGIIALLTLIILSLPYIYLGGLDRFLSWITSIWLQRQGIEIKFAIITSLLFLTWLQSKNNLSLSLVVVLSVILSQIFAGMFFKPFYTYFYIFPFLYWLPEWITEYLQTSKLTHA